MIDCMQCHGVRWVTSLVSTRAVVLAVMLAVAFGAAPTAAATPAVPVTIGEHGEDFDACPTFGALRRSTVLRAAPSAQAEAMATLPRGAALHLCVDAPDGRWFGVVVHGDAADCGVSSAVPRPRRYRGPCRAGWVPVGSVRVTAG